MVVYFHRAIRVINFFITRQRFADISTSYRSGLPGRQTLKYGEAAMRYRRCNYVSDRAAHPFRRLLSAPLLRRERSTVMRAWSGFSPTTIAITFREPWYCRLSFSLFCLIFRLVKQFDKREMLFLRKLWTRLHRDNRITSYGNSCVWKQWSL
jgi:hypothetical protein